MHSLYVMVLQSDPRVAASLTAALATSFPAVQHATSPTELRGLLNRDQTGIVIVDIEAVALSEVQRLSRDFPKTCIVCTHPVPDEDMWMAALAAGATDVCPSSDISGIVRSARGSAQSAEAAAA
jgi:hypothetical protein